MLANIKEKCKHNISNVMNNTLGVCWDTMTESTIVQNTLIYYIYFGRLQIKYLLNQQLCQLSPIDVCRKTSTQETFTLLLFFVSCRGKHAHLQLCWPQPMYPEKHRSWKLLLHQWWRDQVCTVWWVEPVFCDALCKWDRVEPGGVYMYKVFRCSFIPFSV